MPSTRYVVPQVVILDYATTTLNDAYGFIPVFIDTVMPQRRPTVSGNVDPNKFVGEDIGILQNPLAAVHRDTVSLVVVD